MEIELKKLKEQFDMSDYADEAPPEAEYPKEISTIAADNGYIFKIGCQYFVSEGDVDKATEALKRYLSLDPSVVKEYSCKFEKRDMLYEDDSDLRPDPEGKATSRLKTPVFSSFRNRKPDVAIFNVVNGTVTLNYHNGTATVKQGFFTAHEFKSEIK